MTAKHARHLIVSRAVSIPNTATPTSHTLASSNRNDPRPSDAPTRALRSHNRSRRGLPRGPRCPLDQDTFWSGIALRPLARLRCCHLGIPEPGNGESPWASTECPRLTREGSVVCSGRAQQAGENIRPKSNVRGPTAVDRQPAAGVPRMFCQPTRLFAGNGATHGPGC
jgi:hypothetical protein